ncbi:MAG: hypothetical protein QM627_13885 [Luteolibacter sp.]
MYRSIIRRSLALTAAFTASVFAGTETPPNPTVQPAKKSAISGEVGVTIANQYNTRGIIVQDDGVTFQPYLNLYLNFYEGKGFINSSSVFLGLWSDVSSDTSVSGPGNPGSHFTEFDYGLGLTVNFAERWNFTTFYNRWTSPADAYGDGHWINGTLSYNDAGLLHENFSIKPYITVLRDLGGDAATGLEKNTWNFEPGIRPNYTFFSDSQTPLNVALLVKAGLGSDFYAGETFGYLAVGPQFSTTLGFIDPAYGQWITSLGYLYYRLGDTLEPIRGRSSEHLFTYGVSVKF